MPTSRTAAGLATLLALTACGQSTSGTPKAAPDSSTGEAACATVDTPFLDVEPRSAVITAGDSTYMVNLTIQTTNDDHPGYVRDSATILDGMQVLPAS